METLIKLSEVISATGLSRPSIYRLKAGGKFPQPIKLSGGMSASIRWRKSEIVNWINSLQSQPTPQVTTFASSISRGRGRPRKTPAAAVTKSTINNTVIGKPCNLPKNLQDIFPIQL